MLESLENVINSTEDTLETKLLKIYVISEIVWALINAILSLIVRMPMQTFYAFLGLVIGLPVFFGIANLTKQFYIFSKLYFVLALFTIPLLWYSVGGSRSSGNILFVAELQLFTMCLRGRMQKVFIGASVFSTMFLMMMSKRMPDVFPLVLDNRQYATETTILGLSTSALIVVLLVMQKREYMIEREKVIKSEEALRQSNQMQKTFLANMSHEIRSPLGIVLGFNDLIDETNDMEQIHEYTKNIRNSGKLLQTVINDILDYSKIESGKLELITVDYSLDEVISDINYAVKLKCEQKGLKYETKISNNLPRYLYGDNIRIKQVLTNILSNAAKYTDTGFVRFEVDCLDRTATGVYKIQFKVTDSGRGISEGDIPKLFDAFQRLQEGYNRGIEGTGLGLAISKSLLDEMHGEIAVESKLGEGTTFTVVIEQPSGQAVGPVYVEKVEKEVPKEINILVVDDTPMNLRLVQLMLPDTMKSTAVNSGKAFLEEIQKNKYDVILLDHMMPEMDGVVAFGKMKENPGLNPDTPVIMLTANAMSGAEQEYNQMGFSGYISKPINKEKLLSMIETLTRFGA